MTQYAAGNDLIIVFPQVKMDITNISACWDFGNYFFSSDNYYNNEGLQNKALKKMIDRTLEARDESTYDYYNGNIN